MAGLFAISFQCRELRVSIPIDASAVDRQQGSNRTRTVEESFEYGSSRNTCSPSHSTECCLECSSVPEGPVYRQARDPKCRRFPTKSATRTTACRRRCSASPSATDIHIQSSIRITSLTTGVCHHRGEHSEDEVPGTYVSEDSDGKGREYPGGEAADTRRWLEDRFLGQGLDAGRLMRLGGAV